MLSERYSVRTFYYLNDTFGYFVETVNPQRPYRRCIASVSKLSKDRSTKEILNKGIAKAWELRVPTKSPIITRQGLSGISNVRAAEENLQRR